MRRSGFARRGVAVWSGPRADRAARVGWWMRPDIALLERKIASLPLGVLTRDHLCRIVGDQCIDSQISRPANPLWIVDGPDDYRQAGFESLADGAASGDRAMPENFLRAVIRRR